MLAASALVVVSGLMGQVGLAISLVLIAVFAAFLWENVSSAVHALRAEGGGRAGKISVEKKVLVMNLLKFAVGTVGIVWGADLLVDNGSELARLAGISERVIGVTVIAVGTSLPELITTLTAIIKKQSSLSVGNILGANIIDLTLILPLSSLVPGKPLPIAAGSSALDLPACLLVGTIALVPTMVTGKFHRWQGILLLAVYGGYVFLTCIA